MKQLGILYVYVFNANKLFWDCKLQKELTIFNTRHTCKQRGHSPDDTSWKLVSFLSGSPGQKGRRQTEKWNKENQNKYEVIQWKIWHSHPNCCFSFCSTRTGATSEVSSVWRENHLVYMSQRGHCNGSLWLYELWEANNIKVYGLIIRLMNWNHIS